MNLKLKNVRLSFPHLFETHAFQEGDKGKYSAVFLLDKTEHSDLIEQIEESMQELLREAYPKGIPKGFKLCLREGSEKPDTDGYGDDVMFISASSDKRPPVVDTDPAIPMSADDPRFFAGCYVNASIRLWVQDNKWGKRVNAALRAVQYHADGEPFGEKPADPESEFGDETPKKGKSKSML